MATVERRAAVSSRLVELFVGGVQKGGTTALSLYLASHPSLLAPSRKETHFFDNETRVNWSNPDFERDFHARFYPNLGTALAYDATPITIFWRPAIPRILRYNPDAKFIFLFRDPIERAFSHWKMSIASGEENLPFGQAIRSGRNRLLAVPRSHRNWRLFTYVERGFYAVQLRRVLSLVSKERMLLLASRDLADRPGETLEKVASFLSIPAFSDTAPRRSFVGSQAWELSADDARHLRDLYSEDSLEFSRLSGIDTSGWLDGDGRS